MSDERFGYDDQGGTCEFMMSGDRGWNMRVCGRAAKGWAREYPPSEPVRACGIHISGVKRRVENDAIYRAQQDATASANQKRDELCRRLEKLTGVQFGSNGPGRRVTVDPEQLIAFLEQKAT